MDNIMYPNKIYFILNWDHFIMKFDLPNFRVVFINNSL